MRVSQYAPPLAAEFDHLESTPEKYLLWFHHLSWDYPMPSGRTLWDELVIHYSRGVDYVREMRRTWATLASYVDSERYAETSAFLGIQEKEARWWRDACIAYFQSISKRPLPAGYAPPEHTLPGTKRFPPLTRRAILAGPPHPFAIQATLRQRADLEPAPLAVDHHAAGSIRGAVIAAAAPPLLHEIFQDHAVLQRDQPIQVWGEAIAGDRVSVSIDARTVEARADRSGHWHARLPAMHAGGPYVLSVRTQSGASQSINDILVGDVFLCSGQSNMELPVTRTLNYAGEIAHSANDRIRLLSVAHTTSPKPLAHFQTPVAWAAASPDTVGDFSAVCYYFARELQKSVPVPLGLIHSSWGGSRIEPWISEQGLHKVGRFDSSLDLLHVYAHDPKAGNQRLGEIWESWWRARACRLGALEPNRAPTGARYRRPCAIGKPGACRNWPITTAWCGFAAMSR